MQNEDEACVRLRLQGGLKILQRLLISSDLTLQVSASQQTHHESRCELSLCTTCTPRGLSCPHVITTHTLCAITFTCHLLVTPIALSHAHDITIFTPRTFRMHTASPITPHALSHAHALTIHTLCAIAFTRHHQFHTPCAITFTCIHQAHRALSHALVMIMFMP